MGAACSDCIKGEPAKKIIDPVEELNIFKKFYNDTILHEAKKKGKSGLKGAFDELGGGNDGQVTREEMMKYLTRNNYPGDASGLFDLVDVDNEGLVTKAEFGAITKSDFIKQGPVRAFKSFLMKKFKSLDDAFATLDQSQDNHIEETEFVTIVEKLGYDGDATIVYRCLDEDRDHDLSLSEMTKMLGSLTQKEGKEGKKGGKKKGKVDG
mmetsp:Transcript_26904/g.48618  ORF Transcript_26904/g.48618 Transcript_26904/m.48618 type:complete len:209 (-) Transcript_26904:192-818(-)